MITLPAYGSRGQGCAGLSACPGYARPRMGTKKIAAALAALVLAGACGGDGDGNKGDAPVAAPETTTTTAAPETTTTVAPVESSTTSATATPKTTAKPAAASPTTVSTGRTSGPVQTAPFATVFVAAA